MEKKFSQVKNQNLKLKLKLLFELCIGHQFLLNNSFPYTLLQDVKYIFYWTV